MSTTATTSSRVPRGPPAPLKLDGAQRRVTFYEPPMAAPAMPVMPDVFVFSPDGESSFCAFSSEQAQGDGAVLESPLPSPSAPDFAELDRALDFLSKGAEDLSPRRRRVQRRSPGVQDDVLTWLHDVDSQESQSDQPAEEIVKTRPVPESPSSDSSTPRATSPTFAAPGRGLRNKASLVFKRAFATGKVLPADGETALHAAIPRASTSTWDLVLPPTPPANIDAFNAWETRRPRSRLFSSLFFTSSSQGEKPKPSKPSIFKRPKKITQPTSHPRDTRFDRPPRVQTPELEIDVAPDAHSTPRQPLRRRPFSALVLGSYMAKSSVKFPAGTESAESDTSPVSQTSSRDTKQSSATAISSASTPYGDPEMSSSASSSVTTLGNELVTPVSTQPLHGFHAKRLDSFHFDSTTFWDPSSYSFTTR